MGQSRFTKQFKAEAVRLVKESGKPIGQLAKTIGVSAKSLREWKRQADADAGNGKPGVLTTVEKQELTALKKECRELRRERDFLQQAAAYFAKVSK